MTARDRRLSRYTDDQEDDRRAAARGAGVGDQEDVGDQDVDDDPDCVKCGAVDAVENPQKTISDTLPAEPMCRVCLKKQL